MVHYQVRRTGTGMQILANEIKSDLLSRIGMSFEEAVVWRSEYPETSDSDDLSSYGGHALSVEVQEQLKVWQALGVFDRIEIWSSQNGHKDSILIGKLDERVYLIAHWDESTRYVLTIGGLCFELEILARRCMWSSPYFAISVVFLLSSGLSILLLVQHHSPLNMILGTILLVLSFMTVRDWKKHKISNDHYRQIINANADLRKTLQVT